MIVPERKYDTIRRIIIRTTCILGLLGLPFGANANCDVKLKIQNDVSDNPYAPDNWLNSIKVQRIKVEADNMGWKTIGKPDKYVKPGESITVKGTIAWNYCYEINIKLKLNYRCAYSQNTPSPVVTRQHRFKANGNTGTSEDFIVSVSSCEDSSDSLVWSRNE